MDIYIFYNSIKLIRLCEAEELVLVGLERVEDEPTEVLTHQLVHVPFRLFYPNLVLVLCTVSQARLLELVEDHLCFHWNPLVGGGLCAERRGGRPRIYDSGKGAEQRRQQEQRGQQQDGEWTFHN